MSNVTVCARFRPRSSKEMRDHRDGLCVRGIDAETFVFQVCTRRHVVDSCIIALNSSALMNHCLFCQFSCV